MDNLPLLDVVFTEGDRLPELTGVIRDADLTDCTVTLLLVRPAPHAALTKEADVADPTTGAFAFTWDDGDLVAGVGQLAVLRLTDADDLATTLLRFTIDVKALPT